ncbi:hypothetical protein GOODEAATRI_026747 [Goodea atripinnis]|uniref:RNase H type-1 domain-containing protein n=1 Tax=Goodea atripinnis TaxID=208336 RepID=A0ABV0NZI6_9TELE
MVESTKATNTRWGRWEDIMLDPDIEIGPAQPANKKTPLEPSVTERPPEWVLYTDGSKKGLDQMAYWGFILKQHDLSIWEENGFESAKGTFVAHHDLWKNIAELRMSLELEVEHQKAHTREGAHWRGNDEVDRYVQQRKVAPSGGQVVRETHQQRIPLVRWCQQGYG